MSTITPASRRLPARRSSCRSAVSVGTHGMPDLTTTAGSRPRVRSTSTPGSTDAGRVRQQHRHRHRRAATGSEAIEEGSTGQSERAPARDHATRGEPGRCLEDALLDGQGHVGGHDQSVAGGAPRRAVGRAASWSGATLRIDADRTHQPARRWATGMEVGHDRHLPAPGRCTPSRSGLWTTAGRGTRCRPPDELRRVWFPSRGRTSPPPAGGDDHQGDAEAGDDRPEDRPDVWPVIGLPPR